MRRHKLDTLLLDKVKQKMHLHQVNTINFDVRESNLNAQLFLKANNFRFNKIAPDYFKDYFGEDCIPDKESAYCFSFHDYSMVVKELEVCV
jgi:ribosomal protein S18 acetylase RimI-like enzyme